MKGFISYQKKMLLEKINREILWTIRNVFKEAFDKASKFKSSKREILYLEELKAKDVTVDKYEDYSPYDNAVDICEEKKLTVRTIDAVNLNDLKRIMIVEFRYVFEIEDE